MQSNEMIILKDFEISLRNLRQEEKKVFATFGFFLSIKLSAEISVAGTNGDFEISKSPGCVHPILHGFEKRISYNLR